MVETFRPAVLPDNKKLVYWPVAVALVASFIGVMLRNPVVIAMPFIILGVFPGLPIFFHALFHLLVKIELYPEKIVVTDLAGNRFVNTSSREEMHFDDICYIYYLDKEINLLVNLTSKLKKYKIPSEETDYTRENLTAKYGVPDELLHNFEKHSQKALTDYTATGVLMKLQEIYKKYGVTKQTKQAVQRGLANDENFNLEYVRNMLSEYPVSQADIEELSEEFTQTDTDVLAPFLSTRVNMAKYRKAESQRYGTSVTAKTDVSLVLSNKDGSRKLYLMHFHDLSEKDLHKLMEIIDNRRPGIKYLMTKTQINRLRRK